MSGWPDEVSPNENYGYGTDGGGLDMKLYNLGDRHKAQKRGPMASIGCPGDGTVMAVNSGKYACPKKGQWFLSGAKVVAYRAPNDLSEKYWIAQIVKVKTNITVNKKIIATLED